jgi:hypothetical protein
MHAVAPLAYALRAHAYAMQCPSFYAKARRIGCNAGASQTLIKAGVMLCLMAFN